MYLSKTTKTKRFHKEQESHWGAFPLNSAPVLSRCLNILVSGLF